MAKNSSKEKGARSGGSGQFISAGFATKHASTTIGEARGGGGIHGGVYRSAKSGEFVSTAYTTKPEKTTAQDNKLERIEKSVEALSDQDLKAFTAWFDEHCWQRWDRQVEADAKAGKLDRLVEEARREIAAGKTRPL